MIKIGPKDKHTLKYKVKQGKKIPLPKEDWGREMVEDFCTGKASDSLKKLYSKSDELNVDFVEQFNVFQMDLTVLELVENKMFYAAFKKSGLSRESFAEAYDLDFWNSSALGLQIGLNEQLKELYTEAEVKGYIENFESRNGKKLNEKQKKTVLDLLTKPSPFIKALLNRI